MRELIAAGEGGYGVEDERVLEQYNRLQTMDKGVPVFLGALMADNLRQNYFGVLHLARVLGEKLGRLPLNEVDSGERVKAEGRRLVGMLAGRGYGKYAGVAELIVEGIGAETT